MPERLQQFAQMAEGRATKSTAMHPVLWMVGLTLFAFVGASTAGAALWVLIFLGALVLCAALVALYTFRDFARKNPELLRGPRRSDFGPDAPKG